MFTFVDHPNVYRFPIRLNFSETPFTYGGLFFFARTIATLGINNRASETLGITVQLKIPSEATNFIT
jgi:hypothetical protein